MRRIPWGLLVLLLLLVVIPVAEVYLLIQVGERIGAPATIAILLAEALLGGWLMRREGNRAWASLDATFRSGRMPSGELADAALILVGGVLLMLPGFVTDVVGFVFLLPMTRPAARHLLGWFVARRVNRLGVVARRAAGPSGRSGAGPGGVVIDGEVVPDTDGTRQPGVRDPGTDAAGPVIRGEIEDDPRPEPTKPR